MASNDKVLIAVDDSIYAENAFDSFVRDNAVGVYPYSVFVLAPEAVIPVVDDLTTLGYFSHVHRPGNEIVLVYCLEFAAVPNREYWEAQTKEGREKGKHVQEKFSAKCASHGVQPKLLMDFDKAGEYICRMAKEEGATMIAMGTRGMGTIRRTILGSVSDYVLHHANCPVMVVRHAKDKA